jgi:NitT/TauT family transport system substrate-binding protein
MRHVSAPDQARWGGRAGRPGRRAAGVAAAAAGLILVTGCHVPGFSSSDAAGPTASGTITVMASPGVADAPLYIGLRDGLFSRVGLTVHVVSAGTVPQEVTALGSGRADVAFGDYANMFYVQEEQHPAPHLLVLTDGYDAAPNVVEVLTLPGSGINSPAGLAGKTIGTDPQQAMPTTNQKTHKFQPYSLETLATASVLTSDNVDPTKIGWDPMPDKDLISALHNHTVDAILATEPTITEAETLLGAVPVLDACTGATANLPLDGYFTTNAYATKHAQVLAAFRAALDRAQSQASMTAPLQTALTKSAGLTARTAAMVTTGTYPTELSAPDLQRVVNLLFNFSVVPSNIPVSSMVVKPNGS